MFWRDSQQEFIDGDRLVHGKKRGAKNDSKLLAWEIGKTELPLLSWGLLEHGELSVAVWREQGDQEPVSVIYIMLSL